MQITTTNGAPAITDPRTWLEANAAVVRHAVRQVARRRRLARQDADDLLSQVFTHLLKDDYRALRVFRGSSSHITYLSVIVERQLLDLRTARWGRWRPSAAARKVGPAAVRFEQLVYRDGVDPVQARAATGHADQTTAPTRTAGARLARRFVGLDKARDCVVNDPDPLEQLMQQRHEFEGVHVQRHLAKALRQLGPADRALIRLRHVDGLPISQIARRLSLNQHALYPRMASLHARLRRLLAKAGIDRDVLRLTSAPACWVPPVLVAPKASSSNAPHAAGRSPNGTFRRGATAPVPNQSHAIAHVGVGRPKHQRVESTP